MELILVLCLLGIIVALLFMQRTRDAKKATEKNVVVEPAAVSQAPYKVETPPVVVEPPPVVVETPPVVVETPPVVVETPTTQKVARPKKVKVVTPVTTDPVIPPKKPRKTSGPRKAASK